MNSTRLLQQNPDYIELVQLTDTHIFSDPEATFDGINTLRSLKHVITFVRQNQWPPDAVLVTGDLVHEPSQQAYERLAEILETIRLPVFCIPGNHDAPDLMHGIITKNNISTVKVLEFRYWTVLMLDTFLENTHAGYLSENELEFLDKELGRQDGKHVLICLHHPPVSIDSSWMDNMSLKNPGDLFMIIDKYSCVQGILWGHIHQKFDSMYKKVRLMATPSTCVQFTPGTSIYIKDNKPPGFRRLKLYNSGKIDSEVVRVDSQL